MNTLFVLNCPLGDCINFSCFLKDYHESFMDEVLYIRATPSMLDELFKNNHIVNLFRDDIHYDKIYEYRLGEFDSGSSGMDKRRRIKREEITLQDTPYIYFDKVYHLPLVHRNRIPCIELDEYQKSKIESDKPLCLINAVAQYFLFDARYLGFSRFQRIVDDFYHRVNFFSIGNLTYGLLQTNKLNHVYADLVNQTSIYELLHYIYNADIILTSESGIWHAANIRRGKPLYVIVPAGARQTHRMNRYDTPDVNVYWLENKDKEAFSNLCYNGDEKGCLIEPLFSEVNDYRICRDDSCRFPVVKNNELISRCLSHVAIEDVEAALNDCLNKIKPSDQPQYSWHII